MARVAEQDVQAIIDADENLSVAPFIATATALTDYVSSRDTKNLLNSALLVEIEKYLAAHAYAHRDQLLATESQGDASGVYQGQFGMGLQSTQYGQMAMTLDVTGELSSLSKGKVKVGMTWLGKPPSDQILYEDRD